MWLMVMFDLPMVAEEEKAEYRHFHDFLLDEGFIRLQYSVYVRPCASDENASVHAERVKLALPHEGEVRLLTFTDKQFARMQVYYGHLRRTTERPPEQIMLL